MQYTDQVNHTIELVQTPRRIISLVPSQTELLFDLGLDEEIVGVTRFCVHPATATQEKTVIGGTKEFDFGVIDSLKPDLIVGNKEENYWEGIERLRRHYPVWLSDILTLADALAMIASVGAIVGRAEAAAEMVAEIAAGIDALPAFKPLRAVYLIWSKPYMVAGHKTFAHEMMYRCGFVNAFGHLPRYPEVEAKRIAQANADLILLPSEPFPFSQRHQESLRERFPDTPAVLVDGQMFTWYGSRLRLVPAYFSQLRQQLRPLEMKRALASYDLRRIGANGERNGSQGEA
jgi:ABC-type Fe3+-hydroxamate transport system substrate-binding protein